MIIFAYSFSDFRLTPWIYYVSLYTQKTWGLLASIRVLEVLDYLISPNIYRTRLTQTREQKPCPWRDKWNCRDFKYPSFNLTLYYINLAHTCACPCCLTSASDGRLFTLAVKRLFIVYNQIQAFVAIKCEQSIARDKWHPFRQSMSFQPHCCFQCSADCFFQHIGLLLFCRLFCHVNTFLLFATWATKVLRVLTTCKYICKNRWVTVSTSINAINMFLLFNAVKTSGAAV